ncbi:MAG TPA: sugar-binding protein [Armatimonadota bacterium]|jgi:ribose transport system substrate-binding protein
MFRVSLRHLSSVGLALISAAIISSCGNKTATPAGSGAGGSGPAADLQPPAAAQPPSAEVTKLFEAPRKPSGPLKFQIISNAQSAFWEAARTGMKDEARALGVEATFNAPDKSEVPQQRRLLEDAVSKGVDGIAVSAMDPEALEPIINELMMKGKPPVPIITIDSDSPASHRLAYIGTNNFQAGKAAGEAALKFLPKGGDIVAFVGNKGAANATERVNGFRSVTEPHGIKVIAVMEDRTDKTLARKNVEDVINKYGDKVAGFLGVWAYNPPAIVAAVQSAHKRAQYKIFCFDLEPGTIDALKAGQVDYTIVQKPYKFGSLGIQFLTEINRKGLAAAQAELKMPANGVIDTGVTVVTKDNVDKFVADLNKLGIKSS